MDTPARCWFVCPLGCSLPLPRQALETGPQSFLNGIGVERKWGEEDGNIMSWFVASYTLAP